jgi:hypothetical protein
MTSLKKRYFRIAVLLFTLVLCILITEIWRRDVVDSLDVLDERNLNYRCDSDLGWFPIENSTKSFTGSRTINVKHNSRGFRDSEHIIETKPRIIFLGDSFVWGYDVEKEERFTEKLRIKLPNWSIYNFGVSGYGTDQEYLLLKKHYDFYKPNIVFLVFYNDDIDNSTNIRHGGYFKPYFMADGNKLKLGGTPVPKSENYFFGKHRILAQSYCVRFAVMLYLKCVNPPEVELKNPTLPILENMHKFLNDKGAQFIIGLGASNLELEKFLTSKNIPYVRLSNPYTYPGAGQHWTPEGHTFVSEQIYDFLMKGNYFR